MRANSKSWQKNSINIIADAILTTNGEQKNDRSTQNGSVKQYCDNCVISGQDMQFDMVNWRQDAIDDDVNGVVVEVEA